jgi:hypothetical protein
MDELKKLSLYLPFSDKKLGEAFRSLLQLDVANGLGSDAP